MKDWVKSKLECIEELFPAERINRSKNRWERMWRGEKPDDRYPFVFANILFNYYDDVHTPEERLRMTLDEIIIRGRLNDDYIPSIFPGCKQSTIPSMFGAKEIVLEKDHWCEKIIKDYEDIDNLPELSMEPGTVAYEWLSMQQYFIEETEGRIPIHVTDMQGPVDVSGQLWGYDNLFVAAYEKPEYYHRLLSKVTNAFISFWKRQQEVLGDCFMGTHLFAWDWVPKDAGATLSADSIVMVSPDFFDEFYKPYLAEIGKALGGLTVHSCGYFQKVVKNLCAVPYLKGVNVGQMKMKQLVEAGFDNKILVSAGIHYDDVEEFFSLARQLSIPVHLSVGSGVFPVRDGNWFPIPPSEWTEEDWCNIKRKEEKILQEVYII